MFSLFGLAAAFVGGTSDARPPWPDPHYSPYSVTLEDEQGNSLETFRHDGTTFALGHVGGRYEVRIENHTGRRVEAVLTVDGRDAVSGNLGDFVNERGYIVAPHGSVRVDGFRRTLTETAAFRFSAPDSSYSSRMGTPENVGVIGVAFFPERPVARPGAPVRAWRDGPNAWLGDSNGGGSQSGAAKRGAPSAAPSALPAERHASAARSRTMESAGADDARAADGSAPSRLGTEYGEPTWSPVTEVSFQRQNRSDPATVVTLRYDDADGLVARGIDVYPRRYTSDWSTWSAPASPDPFPRNGFAPPPP